MKKPVCKKCGQCCKTIALEIPQPKSKNDFKSLCWYLFHKNTALAIDHTGFWGIIINSRCKNLSKNNKCRIYNNRPQLCKKYNPPYCPGCQREFRQYFSTVSKLENYLKEKNKL